MSKKIIKKYKKIFDYLIYNDFFYVKRQLGFQILNLLITHSILVCLTLSMLIMLNQYGELIWIIVWVLIALYYILTILKKEPIICIALSINTFLLAIILYLREPAIYVFKNGINILIILILLFIIKKIICKINNKYYYKNLQLHKQNINIIENPDNNNNAFKIWNKYLDETISTVLSIMTILVIITSLLSICFYVYCNLQLY